MRAAPAIAALLLTLAVYAHGRALQQGGIAIAAPGGLPTITNSTTAASPWSNYTREVNTLYIGVKPISSTVAASDEACASLCNNDQRCEWFAWCPQNVTNGCGIPAANSTFTSNVPPGGCVITYDSVPKRWAVFVAYGNAVPFVSGTFAPPDATANSTATPTTRKLLQGGGAGATVWGNFTRVKRTFWQGIDGLPPTTAQTAEECAGACNANSKCELWSLCPPAAGAAGCEVASFDEKAAPVVVPGGTCLLSYDGTPDQLAYFEM